MERDLALQWITKKKNRRGRAYRTLVRYITELFHVPMGAVYRPRDASSSNAGRESRH